MIQVESESTDKVALTVILNHHLLVKGHLMVSHHALQSTYMIAFGNGTGTCFTIEVEGSQYLISAEHVVPIDSGPVTVGILREEGFVDVLCDYVGSDKAVADVIVLKPRVRLPSPTSLIASCKHTFLSQDVYFLGFPYGLSDNSFAINNGFPIPLVKKACISMMQLGNADSKYLILDGHNNPGFSGGPVVWNTPAYSDDIGHVFRLMSAT